MIYRVLDLLTILLALAAVYGLPPLLFISALCPGIGRVERLLLTFGAGLASQSVIGLLWNHWIGHHAWIEVCLYLGVWLAASLFAVRRTHPPMTPQFPIMTSTAWILPLILLIGISLRSLDALHHAALGQSDAYSHLQFVRHILKYGFVLNIVYPPGYSWVLALPTLAFNLDPYLMARYAGPFFGGLLILALYQLGRHHSISAARFGAFLAACFPGFYLLIKTGMGAFANQLGLFFLPLALHLYLRRLKATNGAPVVTGLFTLILLGLAASVPLLMFNLFLIIAVHRLVCLFSSSESRELSEKGWFRGTVRAFLPFLPALILVGYHFLRPGELHVNATATMLTGIQTPAASAAGNLQQTPGSLALITSSPAGRLLVDLLTVKRMGLGGGLMTLVTLALTALFAGLLIAGFRARCAALELLGGWGLLAMLQTTTGLLDFSLYQRSGWSLLEATVWAGGVVCAVVTVRGQRWRGFRTGVRVALVATVILAFYAPPAHRFIMSGAEDELVYALRELSHARLQADGISEPLCFEHTRPGPLMTRAAQDRRLIVMTRCYTLFPGDQGDLPGTVMDPAAHIIQALVGKDTPMPSPSGPILCLLDGELDLGDMGLLSRISPELTSSLAGYQPLLHASNRKIEDFLASLPRHLWSVTTEMRGPKLKLVLAKPIDTR